MNRYRRWIALAMLAALIVVPLGRLRAGQLQMKTYPIFGGGTGVVATDTAEVASDWFPVRGASKVTIRITSNSLSAWTGADSVFADSIATWKVLFSDSICCTVTGAVGRTVQSAADSVLIDFGTVRGDTTNAANIPVTNIGQVPILRPLAKAKTGSGFVWTLSLLTSNSLVGAPSVDHHPFITKGYMRIRTQAVRRNTLSGQVATQGARTRGVNGLSMVAYVWYPND